MSPPAFTLGINTCFAVKRWPHPEEWAAIVSDRLGLDVVQHSLDLVDLGGPQADTDGQADRLRAACRDGGLHLHSTFTGLAAYSANLLLDGDVAARGRAERWLERVIAFSARAGADHAGGHVGSLSVADHADPVRRAARWAELHAALDRLAGRAHAAGLRSLLIENMASAREPSRMSDVEDLLTDGDAAHAPVALCLDVGHQCVPGTSGEERDPYAWLRRLGARAPVVHLQQSDAEADHHWPFTPEHNARGRIDGAAVLDALTAAGARRTALILEVIPSFEADDASVLRDLDASVAYWRQTLDDHRRTERG